MPGQLNPMAAPGRNAVGPVLEHMATPDLAVFEAQPSTSEWVGRAVNYAVQAVANAEGAHRLTIERRLEKPSRHWTSTEVSRVYPANADGGRRFREEADVLMLHGYEGWLETEDRGHPRGGRVHLATSLRALADPDEQDGTGRRTVTWAKEVRVGRA